MTAVIGGSTKFVTAVLLPSEVHTMYSIPVNVESRLRTNPSLRDYARLEYGHAEYAWFLALARSPVRPDGRRHPIQARLRLFRPRTARRPVACKGTPHRGPSDVVAPG